MNIKKWKIKKIDEEMAKKTSKELNLPFFLACLIQGRGVSAGEVLSEEIKQEDPYIFKGMKQAVKRIKQAIDAFERICVYGDYDADGVTATALLYSYLSGKGANAMYYIPERDGDGYGLNKAAIKSLKEQGVSLIITVDNGISAGDEIEFAKSIGVDTIVTDHHRPPENLPHAVAIVDQHQKGCESEFKHFAGVGLAYKLVTALEGNQDAAQSYLDLVALGTVADAVTLTGENRYIVKQGVKCISEAKRLGFRAMLEESGLLGKAITAQDVAFMLAPRINASGRLSSAEKCVKLMCSQDSQEVFFLASELGRQNELRKQIEKDILNQAETFINSNKKRLLEPILIVWGQNWHAGVIGIVAAKLVERYCKPCIVIAIDGGGGDGGSPKQARGSGRSVEGFSLHDAVSYCSEDLTRFGGHPMAVGFDINPMKIEAFCQKICDFAKKQGQIPPLEVQIDYEFKPHNLSLGVLNQIAQLEPFGSGNPLPLFAITELTLQKICPVGGGKHLRLHLKKAGKTITAMRFGVTLGDFGYKEGDVIDIAFTLTSSEYMGQETLSLYVKDLRFSQLDQSYIISQQRLYEGIQTDPGTIEVPADCVPGRDDLAVLYRYLRKTAPHTCPLYVLYFRIKDHHISFAKLLFMLDIMQELELINLKHQNGVEVITLPEQIKKVDFKSSQILTKLVNNLSSIK